MTTPATPRLPKPPVRRHGFGRLRQVDLRNLAHPMSAHLPRSRGAIVRTDSRFWNTAPPLDQGATPQCVGYSSATLLMTGPVVNRKGIPTGEDIYRLAQQNDEWASTPHDGSSGLGAMKALQQLGYVTEYVWAANPVDLCHWVIARGPVLVGSAWTDQMCYPVTPKRGGAPYVVVEQTAVDSPSAEGHEWCVFGCSLTARNPDGSKGYIELLNSWGGSWGARGRARISLPHLEMLWSASADAAAPTEIRKVVIGKAAA